MKKNAKKKQLQKGPEFWRKKLHAAKVNLKRSIKKAKDLHVRKLVKKLKANQTAALDAELKRAKEVDVEALWAEVLEGRVAVDRLTADGHEDDVQRHLAASDGVAQQMMLVDEMREKLRKAEQDDEEGNDGNRHVMPPAGEMAGATEAPVTDDKYQIQEDQETREKQDTTQEKQGIQDKEQVQKSDKKQRLPQKKQEKKKAKNRMGQRARQRLAEKQYGKEKALHIIENRARDQKRKEQQERKREKGDKKGGSRDDKHRHAKQDIAKEDAASLHPSWQAKKAAQKLVIPDISAGAAKNKIVFD